MGSIQKGLTIENNLEENFTPESHMFHLVRYSPSLFCATASRCFVCESSYELVNHLLLHCTFIRQIWTMFRAIFGVQWVMPGCIKLALSSWLEQLHQRTMSTVQLLFLPSFSGLSGWRGMMDVSTTREARIKRKIIYGEEHPSQLGMS